MKMTSLVEKESSFTRTGTRIVDVSNMMFHGHGKYIYASGAKTFENDEFHESGTYFHKSNTCIETGILYKGKRVKVYLSLQFRLGNMIKEGHLASM